MMAVSFWGFYGIEIGSDVGSFTRTLQTKTTQTKNQMYFLPKTCWRIYGT